jgi:acetolactate synthase-1/2/3 large subunit
MHANTISGSEALARTLVKGDVRVCFANPGTSEIHFVSALDRVEGIRCVLALFEGVATGAADGYYRLSGEPAATLLHLGPGLANGLANLHNARKARSGIINVVGEHATYHLALNAPLTSDIQGVARPFSDWIRVADRPERVAQDAAEAIAAARRPPGQIATLILPADAAWGPAGYPDAIVAPPAAARRVDAEAVEAAARALHAGKAAIVLGGAALRGRALAAAGRVAATTGSKLLCENLSARVERGAGRVPVARIPYVVDQAVRALAPFRQLVLAGAQAPVAFFAYPDKPSLLAADGAVITPLAAAEDDLAAALEALADAVGAAATPPVTAALDLPALPSGRTTLDGVGAVIAALLPDNAVVIDEALTSGRSFGAQTTGARPHDWLNSMGGSIGFGLPLAVGAAVAAPDRKVIALEGDGSSMYTPQALWTMARENLDVTIVVFANRAYRILQGELAGIAAGPPGERARDMLSLDRPALDFVGLARAQGVEAGRAEDLDGFARELARGIASSGPYLIELVLPADGMA